ncbi:MAG: carboxypeptidase-like regulatory domain-containing protein [Bacteroidaceae bacterium]|nr:carboxypeptidase-like regulatory domain-containing protein [Bacteroidaceae bacterium]
MVLLKVALGVALYFSSCSVAVSQVLTGKVVDSSDAPLEYVSVVLTDVHGKSLNFTNTETNGGFSISKKEGSDSIHFVCLGYGRLSIGLNKYVNGQTVRLTEAAINIKEVKVKAQRIIQTSDTLTYSVAGFKHAQDREIADVIKRMPGLEVKNDGTITYQGKPINKFYIENMDLLGTNYSQASENLDAKFVKSVQVLENHQPVNLLRGVQFSDQAALNLVLNDDAKNVWSGTFDVGLGTTIQDDNDINRDIRIMEMFFGKQKQSISMVKSSNVGKDISHEIQDLIDDGYNSETKIVSEGGQNVSNLEEQRYNFNNSNLFATNWLFKTKNNADLRIQLHGLYDDTDIADFTQTTYYDTEEKILVTEDSKLSKVTNEWKGEILYEINNDKKYVSNSLKWYSDFNKLTGPLTYSVEGCQSNGIRFEHSVKPRKLYFADCLDWKKVYKANRVLELNAMIDYNKLPTTMRVIDNSIEKLNLQSAHFDMLASVRHKLAGFYISYQFGMKGAFQWLDVENNYASGSEKYGDQQVFIAPSMNYQHNRIKFRASAKFNLINRNINDQWSTFPKIEPSVMLTYTPFGNLTARISYNESWSAERIESCCKNPYFISYNTLYLGNNKLESYNQHTMQMSVDYRNVMSGLFSSGRFIINSIEKTSLLQSRFVDGIYTLTATDTKRGQNNYTASGRISKTFGLTKTTLTLAAIYSWKEYSMLQNNNVLDMKQRDANVKLEVSMQPNKHFSISESSSFNYRKMMNTNNLDSTKPLKFFEHSLSVCCIFEPFRVELDNELYHSNDRSVSNSFFTDLSVSYVKPRYEISMQINNVFGCNKFEYTYLTDFQSVYSSTRLRQRELLVKVSFNINHHK